MASAGCALCACGRATGWSSLPTVALPVSASIRSKEATASLLSRLVGAVVWHGRLQPGLQVLPELGHLEVAADGSPGRPSQPDAIAAAALGNQCKSVAFTYNDPVIFAEYAIDVAIACHALGIKTVAVTAGYICTMRRARDFYRHIDAANVDLKAFSESFYRDITASQLQPVLDTLRYLVHETDVWTEITTLLIPGHNDSTTSSRGFGLVAATLRPDVPLHFSAFHPDYRMTDVPATPHATLRRARDIALRAGSRHVYVGNVHDVDGDTTSCPTCREPLIVRDWYQILDYRLDPQGCRCRCQTPLAGRFDPHRGTFGRRRIPIYVGQ